jgi:hypothetical protein
MPSWSTRPRATQRTGAVRSRSAPAAPEWPTRSEPRKLNRSRDGASNQIRGGHHAPSLPRSRDGCRPDAFLGIGIRPERAAGAHAHLQRRSGQPACQRLGPTLLHHRVPPSPCGGARTDRVEPGQSAIISPAPEPDHGRAADPKPHGRARSRWPGCRALPHPDLRTGVAPGQSRWPGAARNELAAILERLRQAHEGAGNVTLHASGRRPRDCQNGRIADRG